MTFKMSVRRGQLLSIFSQITKISAFYPVGPPHFFNDSNSTKTELSSGRGVGGFPQSSLYFDYDASLTLTDIFHELFCYPIVNSFSVSQISIFNPKLFHFILSHLSHPKLCPYTILWVLLRASFSLQYL